MEQYVDIECVSCPEIVLMEKKREMNDINGLHLEELREKLNADFRRGLSQDEAEKRLDKYGANEIEEKSRHPVIEFLSHFWGPIPWMIEVAVILSAIAQRWEDFVVIFVMLLINGGVSYWHENKAHSAIEALREKLAPEAQVIRDGARKKIPARELVPGDVIIVKIGNLVPADAKLLGDQYLSVDESALTGESLPVDKEEGDGIYSGTTVKRGEAKAIVTATGTDTKFAATVKMVEEAGGRSHFQKAVLRIGYFLIGITGVLVAVIIATGILRDTALLDVLIFAMVVTIAGIPQALPAVLSVTMTLGARHLAREKAIVSKLSAMEEMAGLEVLFADKTGTLTKNQLEVQEPVLIDSDNKSEVILMAMLTTEEDTDDPIDRAIRKKFEDGDQLKNYEIEDKRPFNPTDKRAEADIAFNGKKFTVAKGAPQVILKLCDPDEEKSKKITGKVDELGENGYRSLGVASRTGGDWQYLGLLPMLDPPREDSKEIVKKALEHGIDIRMVTGDHQAIAKQVARQLSLDDNILEAKEFFSEKEEKDQKAKERILKAAGFAEVTPEHKFNIIKRFQEEDKIVGMTGDGVNDAPALKQADVGIAVSNATDAARSAAALVLSAPGLGVIINAVEEARKIFERMTSYATFRITESLRVLLFITLSILIYNFFPVTAIMIVLLAILNDIPIMAISVDNVPVSKKPVRWDMKRVLSIASVLSLGGVATSFLFFWFINEKLGFDRETLQTMLFLKLLVAGHMTIFLTRNTGWIWDKPYPHWLLILALEGTQVIGTLVAVYGWLIEPIGWGKALSVWGFATVSLLALNILKIGTLKMMNMIGDRKKSKTI